MTYHEAINYLESFINYERMPAWPYKKSLKLERIKAFLETINNPHYDLHCIHIAGSKGKGSTCAFIAYILRQAGYKVGLYTSPHLSDFRERIRILTPQSAVSAINRGEISPDCLQFGGHSPQLKDFEGMISKKGLTDLAERLKPAIEKYNKNSKYGPLSFFEVYTSLAFVYFKEKRVDFTVLETGLGGRLDATNAVNPLICVITPISYEHTQKLGNTLREIAQEKTGIIKVSRLAGYPVSLLKRNPQTRKPANPQTLFVVTAPQEKEASRVIKNKCKEVKAKLYEVGKDILYEKTKLGIDVKGILKNYFDLQPNLLGQHQLINAAVAIGVVEALGPYGVNIGMDSVQKGLYTAIWPGRCEVISKKPLIVLDGAQNVASIQALKKAIKDNFQYVRLILIFGISNDKDIKGVCKEICPFADTVILTKANNPRAADVEEIERIIRPQTTDHSLEITKTKTVKEAISEAKNIAAREDLILVTGSLFVVGEAREFLQCKK